MLTVAVAHDEETFRRIRAPLADRDIAIEHVTLSETTTRLSSPGIDSSRFDAGLVFPSRVMEGGVLDAFLDVPWVNGRRAILRSRNKAETLARLEVASLPTPETVLVSNPVSEGRLEAAIETLEPPFVVKPNSTTRGVGILKVDDLDSLRGAIDYLELIHEFPATGDRSYLLQEFLPNARDFRIMIVDGEYAGAVERTLGDEARRRGQWKHNVHRGATAEAVLPAPRIRQLAEAAAAAMEIPFLGVDVLSNGERTVIAETNARPTVDEEEKYVEDFYDRLAALIRKTATRR